uniref:Death domain-containing protein n=1 Tax=Branchiostoma floridae TaxID=7739 RepID=C3YPG2_BRAFL|eukprot:XP_002601734.1 hypothetical protein BRAFLDRAFT_215159 [Branchiostoma floridae]
MEQRHQKILKKKYKDLTRDLRPDDVMDHLIQEDILDFTDIELVRAQSVTKLQVEKLLAILLTRGPRAFGVFLESLEERYSWLYKDLKKADEEMNLQDSARGKETLTEKELNKLADKLGSEWEKLAIELDFKKSELYKFKEDNKNNVHAQIFDMLCKWKERQGRKATVGNLIHSMHEVSIGEDVYKFLL